MIPFYQNVTENLHFMSKKEWIPKISIILTIIFFFIFLTSPDWIFKNDVMFIVFCTFCILSAFVGYKLNEQIKREDNEKEQ